jgi:hypothetical protein
MQTAQHETSSRPFAILLLPVLSWDKYPLVKPDSYLVLVLEDRSELFNYLGVSVGMAEKNVKRFVLI